MTDSNREAIARPTVQYPPADITPAEFETFVVDLLGCAEELVTGLSVTLHDKISGTDGVYDFDATVRFEFCNMAFLVVVEAKRHKNPIKRELVQVLYQKLMSVGANKGAMVSTAPYQSGALEFARHHGIALATVTEGRFTFHTKSRARLPVMSRVEATERYGLPTFVGHGYTPGDRPGSVQVTVLSAEYPKHVAEIIFGIDVDLSKRQSQPRR